MSHEKEMAFMGAIKEVWHTRGNIPDDKHIKLNKEVELAEDDLTSMVFVWSVTVLRIS